MDISISIYTTGFDLVQNRFDYDSALRNFCSLAEEVVIAINKSHDDSLNQIKEFKQSNKLDNLKIVETDLRYDNPWFDGLLKNEALQNTTHNIKLQLDLDERVPIRHKQRWKTFAASLLFSKHQALMIPVVNLYGDYKNVRWDHKNNVNYKWYLHKSGLQRGPVNFGKLPDGHVNIEKSDTCELIDQKGDLVPTYRVSPLKKTMNAAEYFDWLEQDVPFVFHLGYVDFRLRVIRNQNFWKEHWKVASGKDINIPTEEAALFQPTINHNLKLWDEN